MHSMPRPKHCDATTRKGTRCRNPAIVDGRCAIHPKKSASSRLEKVERGIKLVGSVASGIAGLIKVIEYVVQHFPQIIVYFDTLDGRRMSADEMIARLNDRSQYQYFWDIELWFHRLPTEAKNELQSRFGDFYTILMAAKTEAGDR